jgi:hypothetical protein
VLNSDSFLTNVWNTKDTTQRLIVSKAGSYSVQTLNSEGCLSAASKPIKVEVKPTPARPVIERASSYLMAAKGSYLPDIQFKWQSNERTFITANNILKTQIAGNYRVSAFYQDSINTCTSPPSFDFTFTPDLSDNGLNIYPNPVIDGKIMIESANELKDAWVQIISTEGKIVYQKLLPTLAFPHQIQLQDLAEGSYYVRLWTNDQDLVTRKLYITK